MFLRAIVIPNLEHQTLTLYKYNNFKYKYTRDQGGPPLLYERSKRSKFI